MDAHNNNEINDHTFHSHEGRNLTQVIISFSWGSKSWFTQVNGRLVDSVTTVVIDVIFDLQRQVCFEWCINSLLQNSQIPPTAFFITNTNISIKVIYK